MMNNKKLLFATNNAHKVQEVKAALGDGFEVITLDEYGIEVEVDETEPTLEGNALLKARCVATFAEGVMVFADDTGLEIDALGGAPGVHSARYSGGGAKENIEKVLCEMKGCDNRSAQFRTVIVLIDEDDKEYLFEGSVRGRILESQSAGVEGFGYDPIFAAEGFEESFAEMTLEAKNAISHRGRATAALVNYLKEISSKTL